MRPDAPFLRLQAADVSYGNFTEQVQRLAGGLQAAGLAHNDRLLVVMSNSVQMVATMFAAAWLGAVWVPVNVEFRGTALFSAIQIAQPRLIIVDEAFAEPLMTGALRTPLFVLPAANTAGDTHYPVAHFASLLAATPALNPVEVDRRHPAALLYTSGTTGRAKACELSHEYFLTAAQTLINSLELRSDDVLFCPFPLFHIDASVLTVTPALLLGAVAALGVRFSASRFWDELRTNRATVFDFMGATLSILHKAPQQPGDSANPARLAWGVPVPDWVGGFEDRFDLVVRELYGSTEVGLPIVQAVNTDRIKGSCGRCVDGAFARVVVGATTVPPGVVGELQIAYRKGTFGMLTRYFDDSIRPEPIQVTEWFSTGDLATIDSDGNVFFVGRTKDVIRRRGENISAAEVEEGIAAHPQVSACAAYGVPSDLTEEDVKVSVVLRPGATLDEAELHRFSKQTMARHQVPRYFELVTELPHTPTGKVEKFRLQQNWRTVTTMDFDRQPDKGDQSPRGPS